MQAKVCLECLMSHLITLLQHVKYYSEWQNRQVGGLKCTRWLQPYQLHNLSDHGDKQEASTLMKVYGESFEIWMRTTQYAWTYIASRDNDLSQIPGTSSHQFPSDRDRRARWLSMFGWMRAAEGCCCKFVPATFPMVMPKESQWLTQICSLYDRDSKCHRNYSS